MIRVILCDIEGTTTSISFAHEVLFPVSHRKMEAFIKNHWEDPDIQRELQVIRGVTSKTPDEVIAILREWIEVDKKETNLKAIQGKIWKESFESGAIRGHVYPDVAICFQKWKSEGRKIAIFSSGSIEAQKLIFRFSEAGDLTRWIDAYFDTTTGPKKESASYEKIAAQLNFEPEKILFVSDVEAELDAARQARMQTTLLARQDRRIASGRHRSVASFDDIRL